MDFIMCVLRHTLIFIFENFFFKIEKVMTVFSIFEKMFSKNRKLKRQMFFFFHLKFLVREREGKK